MKTSLICALLACMSVRAAAQPTDVPTEVAFAALKGAYRDGAYAERAVVAVRRLPAGKDAAERPTERREEVLVRIDPGRGLARAGAKAYLELGELRVAAGDGHITVVHTRDPANYVQTDYAGPLTPAILAAAIPTLPLPQLDLSLGDADPPKRLTAYADGLSWQTATVDDQAAPTLIAIAGQSAGRKIELVTDAAGRIREFRAELPPAPAPVGPSTAQPAAPAAVVGGAQPTVATQLRVQVVREPLGDQPTWTIPTDGRTRVKSLTELRPKA